MKHWLPIPLPQAHGNLCSTFCLHESDSLIPVPCLLVYSSESDAFSTLLLASFIQTWQHILHSPCSSARGSCPNLLLGSYKSSVLGELCSPKATIFCHIQDLASEDSPDFPTARATLCTVSVAVSPRPGIQPAWSPKASTLAGEVSDKDELTWLYSRYLPGGGVEFFLEISTRSSLIPAQNLG